jgi:hypothetical protein
VIDQRKNYQASVAAKQEMPLRWWLRWVVVVSLIIRVVRVFFTALFPEAA